MLHRQSSAVNQQANMSSLPAVLVAIDGIDGAGKTTQAQLLAERLNRAGLSTVTSKEPTDGKWGAELRATASAGRLSADRELELFLLDRKEHVRTLIEPSLRSGTSVILDRYYYSTAAYQGVRGMDPVEILDKNRAFAPTPDIAFFIDVPARMGLDRIRKRGDVANHFEREDNLSACARVFDSLRSPEIRRIDGRASIEEVHESIWSSLKSGPLFRVHCAKAHYKDECEPAFCALFPTCTYPRL